jgi:hypothetical protein
MTDSTTSIAERHATQDQVLTAWDAVNNAAQDVLTSLPNQLSKSTERLDAARLEMRDVLMSYMLVDERGEITRLQTAIAASEARVEEARREGLEEAIRRCEQQAAFHSNPADRHGVDCCMGAIRSLGPLGLTKTADIVETAGKLVAMWEHQRIEGLPRSERNAAVEGLRAELIRQLKDAGK